MFMYIAVKLLQCWDPARDFLLITWPHQLGLWGGTGAPGYAIAMQERVSCKPFVGEQKGTGFVCFEMSI